VEWAGEGQMTALFDAVERGDLELARLLLERGSNTTRTRSITRAGRAGEHGVSRPASRHERGLANLVNHKLDVEDAAGLRWFLDRGVDENAHRCLHPALARGRG